MKMKAQAVFEFMVAAMFFFAIVFYTLNYINETVWIFRNDNYANTLETKAAQIAEILVMSPGVWDSSGNPVAVGLAKKWPVLNTTKIKWLNNTCKNDYTGLLRKLEVNPLRHSLHIKINEIGNPAPLVDCGNISHGVMAVNHQRITLSESGNLLKINVWVW
ncbi:MAG TPA: hypothetical protein ENG00_00990 [Candidatus Aenigmarchaeota archaeon]|nr:hypothetical protein [Candidatus Aenigmarchaeota archaeon]